MPLLFILKKISTCRWMKFTLRKLKFRNIKNFGQRTSVVKQSHRGICNDQHLIIFWKWGV